MSLPVFFHPGLGLVQVGEQVAIDGPEGRHAVTVKRLGAGERVVLVDPEGFRAEVTITQVSGKDFLEGTVDAISQVPPADPAVVVIQAIPKSERAELAVDLATQAGADGIVAWAADRCVSRWDAKKAPKALAKWQSAAAAAAKQSRRARLPEVTGPLSTGEVARLIDGHCALVLHEEASVSIKDAELPEGPGATIYVLVGPEGGIGSHELAKLTAAGAQPVKLGPEVLRTASAAMVALAAIGMRTPRW